MFICLFIIYIKCICKTPRLRKEIRDLNQEELNKFIRGVKKMVQGPNPNRLDNLVQTHLNVAESIHKHIYFLFWHRAFINIFENEVNKLEPGFVLPYWDWSLDSLSPEVSNILTAKFMGGNGRYGDHCVKDGPFSYDYPIFVSEKGNKRRCLTRSYTLGSRVQHFPTPELLDQISNIRDFQSYSMKIEAETHITLHNSIGGDEGELTSNHSCNDPLFWIHHTFIDKLWFQWQLKNPNTNYVLPYDTDLMGLDLKIKDIMNIRGGALCYAYQEPEFVKNYYLKKKYKKSLNTVTKPKKY